jgi:hypothetical protein
MREMYQSAVQARTLLPITQFSLSQIDSEYQNFIDDIGPTFDELPLDVYEKRRQQVDFLMQRFPEQERRLNDFMPSYFCSEASIVDVHDLLRTLTASQQREFKGTGEARYRAIAKFEIDVPSSGLLRIRRVSAGSFVQKTYGARDLRTQPRLFSEASEIVTEHGFFYKLCSFIFDQVRRGNRFANRLNVTLHQVSVKVDWLRAFQLPDGIHQDGVDYVVSAIPIILRNVVTPMSSVFDDSGRILLNRRLSVGEGVLHDDRHYWHSVSPLRAKGSPAMRCTLGFDIELEK